MIPELGQLALADFVSTYQPTNQYLPQITFDPTTADFWNLFSIDPTVWGRLCSVRDGKDTGFEDN